MKEKTGKGGHEHSPKLKMAASEIKAILEKYDIAGVCVLHQDGDPGFLENVVHVNPTYSVVEITGGGQMKINPPIVNPEDEGPAKRKIGGTVNMLANLTLRTRQLCGALTQADFHTRVHFGLMPDKKPPNPFKN